MNGWTEEEKWNEQGGERRDKKRGGGIGKRGED